jgi:hypothetical protein
MNSAQERNRLRIAAHNGKADPQFQRDEVALLIHEVERAIGTGKLPEKIEMRLRQRVISAGAALGIPSIAERPIDPYEFNLALVDRAMNADEVAGNLAMAGILGLTS